MTLKMLVAVLTVVIVALPAVAFAAPGPTIRHHKRSCHDAAWQSDAWKACEAKMQTRAKR